MSTPMPTPRPSKPKQEAFVGVTCNSCVANVAIRDIVVGVSIVGAAQARLVDLVASATQQSADKVRAGVLALASPHAEVRNLRRMNHE